MDLRKLFKDRDLPPIEYVDPQFVPVPKAVELKDGYDVFVQAQLDEAFADTIPFNHQEDQ